MTMSAALFRCGCGECNIVVNVWCDNGVRCSKWGIHFSSKILSFLLSIIYFADFIFLCLVFLPLRRVK